MIEEVTPSGSVYYLREPNGALIARVSGSDVQYYHFDALGSTRLLTDGAGAVTDEYSYDAWGNVISHDQYVGSIDQPYQFVGQLGYYTHWQDPNLDLLQLGVRFYDPEIGRFTQKDPIRDGLNWYAYVEGRPTALIDPSGLKPLDWLENCVEKCKEANQQYGRGKKRKKELQSACYQMCSILSAQGCCGFLKHCMDRSNTWYRRVCETMFEIYCTQSGD